MLILMDRAPVLDQVMKVHVPTPVALAETPNIGRGSLDEKTAISFVGNRNILFCWSEVSVLGREQIDSKTVNATGSVEKLFRRISYEC